MRANPFVNLVVLARVIRSAGAALVGLMLVVTAAPSFAEVDLAGDWAARSHEDSQERLGGPDSVAYWGLPLTDEARTRALSFTASTPSILERQCMYYPPYYLLMGPFGTKIWADYDPVTGKPIAWNLGPTLDRAPIKIWMDGRAQPGPLALHPSGGFSTGKWEGDTLVVRTTHMKESLLRRNGVPLSNQTSLTLYISRHSDLLSVTGILDDPVYLTEPYVATRVWKLNERILLSATSPPCTPEIELPDVADGKVPSYLPTQNPDAHEMTELYHIPLDAVMGGAKTMYPEYRKTIKDGYTPPAACTRNCCEWGGGPRNEQELLKCKG